MIATKFHKNIDDLSLAQINAYVILHVKGQQAKLKSSQSTTDISNVEDISSLSGFGFKINKK